MRDSEVSTPVFGFFPFTSLLPHKVLIENSGSCASVKSAPSMFPASDIEADKYAPCKTQDTVLNRVEEQDDVDNATLHKYLKYCIFKYGALHRCVLQTRRRKVRPLEICVLQVSSIEARSLQHGVVEVDSSSIGLGKILGSVIWLWRRHKYNISYIVLLSQ